MDYASRVAEQFAALTPTQSKVAIFVARDDVRAIVNVGESTVSLPFVGMYLPPPGHPVQLELRNGQTVVTGQARALPGLGIITGTGTPRAEVTAGGVPYSLPYRAGYTPALNDNVEIAWSADGGVIQGKITALSNVAPPDPMPSRGEQPFHPDPFSAIDSGSHDAGGWETFTDLWASNSYTSAWFYGAKIRDTIPDTAVIVSAAIYLNARQVLGAAPVLQAHTSPTRPGGAVTFVGAQFALPTRTGWVPIPLTFIDYLKANDGGIGFFHGGYNIFRGVGADRLSGALDLSWTA